VCIKHTKSVAPVVASIALDVFEQTFL